MTLKFFSTLFLHRPESTMTYETFAGFSLPAMLLAATALCQALSLMMNAEISIFAGGPSSKIRRKYAKIAAVKSQR